MSLPAGLPPLPADYWEYLGAHSGGERVGVSELYASPQDPGTRLGRQGDENFPECVLIGRRNFGHHLVLRLERGAWRYAIVDGAAWSVVHEFDSMLALVAYLRQD